MRTHFIAGIFTVVVVVGISLATVAAKEREIQAQFELIADEQEGANLSYPLDTLRVPQTQFRIKVTGNGAKQVTTNFVWNGSTVRGRQVSVRLAGVASSNVDLTTGKVETNLPFELTLANKKYSLPVLATTETITDAFGTISGKRANIQKRSATLRLVGSTKFLIDQKDLDPASGKVGQQTIVVRVLADALIRAVN